MEIYIEYVVFDNLVINTLILLLVVKSLKLKTFWWRILLSSSIGTIVACVMPIFNLPQFLQLIIKFLLGAVMTVCLAKYLKFKTFIFSYLLLLGYTVLLGGVCLATLLAFGTSIEALSAGGYDSALPLGLILLIITFYVLTIVYLVKYISRKRDLMPFLRSIIIEVNGKKLEFEAFIDSGNKLYDTKSGLPVIVLSISGLEKYFSKETIEELMLQGKSSSFKGVRAIPYNTLTGDAKKMVVFDADKLVIKNTEGEYITNSFVVGVSFKRFKDVKSYDVLLNPAVM